MSFYYSKNYNPYKVNRKNESSLARNAVNKFVYVKPEPVTNVVQKANKVLVNPNFAKKVFINPNFNGELKSAKIHVNPSIKSIHINPTVLKKLKEQQESKPTNIVPSAVPLFSTNTKLIRVPPKPPKARPKIQKRPMFSKYKIVKTNSFVLLKNSFKLDNRKKEKSLPVKNKKRYVYVNRFVSIKDIAQKVILRNNTVMNRPGLVDINGILFKTSPNSLKRISNEKKSKNVICKSKFKYIKNDYNKNNKVQLNRIPKQSLLIRRKMSKCNLQCQIYRKYGRCPRNERGICSRKHDKLHVTLCTKFLQGACLNENCLLSHQVSPEKMPTCKFYLEGLCSKDDCQYLHVKISPKADICRDFLEGFCAKANLCDKRHQFLCPSYEKNGSCPKKNCPYPHGNVVRKKSQFKYAKKCSNSSRKSDSKSIKEKKVNCDEKTETGSALRYYVETRIEESDGNVNSKNPFMKGRPKLGELPSYIPLFNEISKN